MAKQMATLMYFQDFDQAQYHLERLENAGYDAVVVDNRTGTEPKDERPLPDIDGEIELQVPEEDAVAAAEVLQEGFDDEMGDNQSIVS